jgi:hypothetical protein
VRGKDRPTFSVELFVDRVPRAFLLRKNPCFDQKRRISGPGEWKY